MTDTTTTQTFSKWDDLLTIHPDLLRGIYAYGFETPSPIQCKSIIPFMEGKNLIAQAQSGTGKTGAFTIGLLSRVVLSAHKTQVLVLNPTRELATQTANIITAIGSMMDGLVVKTIVGGTSISSDVREIQNKTPHVIVGCPGRIYDMLSKRYISISGIHLVVVDEADEMLSRGFFDQLRSIFELLTPKQRDGSYAPLPQLAIFSATMNSNMEELSSGILPNPKEITWTTIRVLPEQLTLEGIKQYYVALDNDNDKFYTLQDLFRHLNVSQSMIYCNSVQRVVNLTESMRRDDFAVSCIHSDMTTEEREQSMSDFRLGKSRILISSNITARGIDVQQVSTVINFDIPKDVATYLHRIGRSGRYGRKGMAINFITKRDMPMMHEIESFYHCQISELPDAF